MARQISAFSLVEVTLALGVIAFAIVGIMALFPAAIQSARISQEETRATFIAQSIFADLNTGTNPAARLVKISTNAGASPDEFLSVNLANPSQFLIGFNQDGLPVGTNPVASYSGAISSQDWSFATSLSISTNGLIDGLSRVEVTVTAPAAAPLTNRNRYPFVTLLRNQ